MGAVAQPKGGPVILVVDDDPDARKVVGRILEYGGYTPLLASDGSEGIRLFRQREKEITIVLLDWHLPGPSGKKVLQTLIELRPGVRVILISGDPEAMTDPNATGDTISILQKPFTPNELMIAVKTVLGA